MANRIGSAGRRQVQTTNRITGDRRWWALAAVLISMFFSSLDQTVVSTAMPNIISDLNGLSIYTWMFTAYILASAVTVPLYGRLSDTFGRKPFYIFGLSVFLVGSAFSGMAQSMTMLVLARGLQGIGAGAMLSMPRATIGDIFDPRERGRWMGVIMSVFALASLIGPGLGGFITQHWGWRWVFYINMPVALVAMGIVWYALPNVRTGAGSKLDWRGSILLAGGLVAMLLAFTWGGSAYPWLSWQVLGLFAAAAVVLTVFILNEFKVPTPVIALEMFRNRTYVSTLIITLFIMMCMFSVMMFLPIFAQGVLGITATHTGYLMTPMMFAFIAGSIVTGQLMTKTGRYKWMAVLGGCFLVAGAFLFTRLGVDTAWTYVILCMIVMGIGIGSLLPIVSTVIQNLFPYKMLGVVNATQQTMTQVAGAIAAPIFGAVLYNGFSGRFDSLLSPGLEQAIASVPPAQRQQLLDPQALVSQQAQAALHQQFAASGPAGEKLYEQFIGVVHQALAGATHELYLLALVFAGLALLATLLLREIRLRGKEFYEEAGTPAEVEGDRPAEKGRRTSGTAVDHRGA